MTIRSDQRPRRFRDEQPAATEKGKQTSPAEAARELLRRRKARAGLLGFTQYTFAEFETNWHHALICHYLDRFAAGTIKRLMIFAPRRHGKSELCSRRLAPYLLGRNPDEQIIACSNTSSLAGDMNRDCQRIMDSPEYGVLFPQTALATPGSRKQLAQRNSEVFEVVGHRGRYHAAGVGQSIVGRGFTKGIIDDPFSGREEADSPVQREGVWKWYVANFYGARGPDAGILIINTRWHVDDLVGRLLRLAEEDPTADQWEVLRLPAVCELEGKHPLDPRADGEALWPTRYPLSQLMKSKAASPYEWFSQYQQRPTAQGAIEWPEEYFNWPGFWFDQWPANLTLKVMALDPSTGADSKAGDYQALILYGRTPDGTEWIEADMGKRPMVAVRTPDGTALTEGMVETAVEHFRIFRPECLAVETNAFQQLLCVPLRAEARRAKVEIRIVSLLNVTKKEVRIRRLGSPLAERKMRFRRTPGTRLLVEQMKQFPTAAHDDGPDSLEMARRAAIELWEGRQEQRRQNRR